MTPGRGAGAARPALLLLPAVLLAGFVVLGGLGTLLAQSLGLLPVVGAPGVSLNAFGAAGPELPASVVITLGIAAASTGLALPIGFGAAAAVLQGGRSGRLVARLGALTVPVPHLVGAATMGLLLADGGVLARVTGSTGAGWPDLVAGPLWTATVLEFAWKESAFVALVVVGTLAGTATGHLETAAALGASQAARLRLVLLPLAAPALTAAGAIVFVYTAGSYEVPWLLGRSSPEPLPVLAVRLYSAVSLTSRPAASAVAVVGVLVAALGSAAALAVLRAARRRR